MKRAVFLASFLLLAASLAMAQDTANSPSQDQSQNATVASRRSSSEVSTVRGCLSGSADNYTLTDRNGAHYRLVGQSESLAAAVGHEVEIRGSEQSTEPDSGEGETAAHYASTFQVSQMEDKGSTCKPVSPSKSLEHPMNEPPSHLMARFEQQPPASPDTSSRATSTSLAAQRTSSSSQQPGNTQNTGNPNQTAPPAASQTPGDSTSPTNPNSQVGNSPANNAGTNPTTVETTGAGVNGSATPTTNPKASPASPNSTTPQANQNDANNPLYERQATDVPWAHHSNDNQNNPNPGNTPNNQPSSTSPH